MANTGFSQIAATGDEGGSFTAKCALPTGVHFTGRGLCDEEKTGINHETGARILKNRRLYLQHHGVNVANPVQFDRLNVAQASDNNGWWFSIVPMEAVRGRPFEGLTLGTWRFSYGRDRAV